MSNILKAVVWFQLQITEITLSKVYEMQLHKKIFKILNE